jgi:preprotein translocase subunit SecG
MQAIIIFIHVLVCFALIGLVLMQHGKGADVGAAFGSGASQTFFGSQGSGNFLSRTTAVLATVFFINCLLLSYLGLQQKKQAAYLSVPQQVVPVNSAPIPVNGQSKDNVTAPATPAVPVIKD